MTTVLFPSRPGSREVDSSFQGEYGELEKGGWFVVECNDGGSVGFPEPEQATEVYQSLAAAIKNCPE